MARIVSLHGVPKKIISDRGSQFTSRFWKGFHENMDTKLNFSSAYHPQTDGQTERTNQVLEDMLRACTLQHGSSWDKSLPYAEFSYNNNYQASLKVSPLRGMRRFKVKGKLSPHFIGPFMIFRRVGEMTYQLELPASLSDVHNVFHVSQLKKCLRVPKEQLPMEELSVQGDLTYTE
jgi:transposase InsO family protein